MSASGTVNDLPATPAQVAVALVATVELGEQLLERAHQLGQAIEAEARRVKNSAPAAAKFRPGSHRDRVTEPALQANAISLIAIFPEY
jgi:hypothetical protein